MKGKRQIEFIKCFFLIIAFLGMLLFMHGCSLIPKGKGAMIDFQNAGASAVENHVTNSTGTVITSAVNGIYVSTLTFTVQSKAINVEKEAVKFTVSVPVKLDAPIRIAENINTNVLFWQVMAIIATLISGFAILIWLILKFKK